MRFEKIASDMYPDGAWYSGIYKIVRYERHLDNGLRPAYAAYYKPHGWKNWGNHVDASAHFYKTMREAQEACVAHSSAAEMNTNVA